MSSPFLDAANAFFVDFSKNAAPARMLTYFSTAYPIEIQHAPALLPDGRIPRLTGLTGTNAVRSYFDLISAHFTRGSVVINHIEADDSKSSVVADTSIIWTWRRSHHRWQEDFICTLRYDETFKIISLTLETVSEPETCALNAVDTEDD
ncbi:hypothetical protein AX14_013419 [Amanita brunnescens Koide BX004]|nr:hypothetical protein AX14_013419 [Amanita brunnescens Koide BX004]